MTATHGARTYSDPDLGQLMFRVQQILEARVEALVIRRGEHLIIAIPNEANRAEIVATLRSADWGELERVVSAEPIPEAMK